jgi:2-hydroxychromene-2-carboxylate isomerase
MNKNAIKGAIQLEVFFDCSSPWTYLAFERLCAMSDRRGQPIDWKPILVGGVFNTVNATVYEARANPNPVKLAYYMKDMDDWARLVGIRIGRPPVFPVNSVKAMRGAFFALDQGKLVPYARAVFESYWGALADISQDEHVIAAAERAGLDGRALLDYAKTQAAKDRLKANTDDLIARGGFGSPTLFIERDDMYFGNDRLELVEAALDRLSGTSSQSAPTTS